MENYEKRSERLWSTKFEEKHNRKPLESEMLDNLQDKMNPEILKKIVSKIVASNDSQYHSNDAINQV